jgi:Uma2 family endonuclease
MATNVDPTIPTAVPGPAILTRDVTGTIDPMPIIAIDLPVMYEDEGQSELGESEPHTIAEHILRPAMAAHLRSWPEYRVFSNLDVYYHPVDSRAYVSPDLMVVRPSQPLPENVDSYRIGVHGTAPVLVIEILSSRSFQQQDLTLKPIIYADLGVAEYILVDGTGEFLEQRLLLRQLQADGGWMDDQDADGGVTSRLGFRIVLEPDNHPRVINAASGKRYVRPEEAQQSLDAARDAANAQAEARRQAEERANALQAELDRLRGTPPA